MDQLKKPYNKPSVEELSVTATAAICGSVPEELPPWMTPPEYDDDASS